MNKDNKIVIKEKTKVRKRKEQKFIIILNKPQPSQQALDNLAKVVAQAVRVGVVSWDDL